MATHNNHKKYFAIFFSFRSLCFPHEENRYADNIEVLFDFERNVRMGSNALSSSWSKWPVHYIFIIVIIGVCET